MPQSAPSYLSLADLITKMKGVPTTNQWDIICSYNIVQLQAFLDTQYNNQSLAKEVTLTTTQSDPFVGGDITYKYDLKFASPKISFIDGIPGNVSLEMNITSGTVTISEAGTPDQTVTIPEGQYTIDGAFPLASLAGDNGPVTPHDSTVTFSEGNVVDNHIIIHFRNTNGANFKISPLPDSKSIDILQTYLLPEINNYFTTQIKEIDYALAIVSNTPDPSGIKVFTPKSFVFTSIGDTSTGVLSIYIQTLESGTPQGNPNPVFQPNNDNTLPQYPIPTGYTASLILSNNLITKSLIAPQLQAAPSSFTVAFNTATDGISATLTKAEDNYITAVNSSGNSWYGGHDYPGVKISLHDNPINLIIQNGKLSLSFTGTQNDISWDETWITFGDGGGDSNGTVDVTISMNKSDIPITVKDNIISFSDINLVASDFVTSLHNHSCSIWASAFGHCSEDAPDYYNNLPIAIPTLNVQLKGLDFFLDTNVLAPGKQIINIDATAGVGTPHDFIVVGSVVA